MEPKATQAPSVSCQALQKGFEMRRNLQPEAHRAELAAGRDEEHQTPRSSTPGSPCPAADSQQSGPGPLALLSTKDLHGYAGTAGREQGSATVLEAQAGGGCRVLPAHSHPTTSFQQHGDPIHPSAVLSWSPVCTSSCFPLTPWCCTRIPHWVQTSRFPAIPPSAHTQPGALPALLPVPALLARLRCHLHRIEISFCCLLGSLALAQSLLCSLHLSMVTSHVETPKQILRGSSLHVPPAGIYQLQSGASQGLHTISEGIPAPTMRTPHQLRSERSDGEPVCSSRGSGAALPLLTPPAALTHLSIFRAPPSTNSSGVSLNTSMRTACGDELSTLLDGRRARTRAAGPTASLQSPAGWGEELCFCNPNFPTFFSSCHTGRRSLQLSFVFQKIRHRHI